MPILLNCSTDGPSLVALQRPRFGTLMPSVWGRPHHQGSVDRRRRRFAPLTKQSFRNFLLPLRSTAQYAAVQFKSAHICDGSHSARIGNAIRITSRTRSVTMNGSTPTKIVEKLTSCTTLLMTNTFMPTGG